MATFYSPRMITDGLILCYDAANVRSYSGSGTSITDLSSNGKSGTLTNGPTFSSTYGGGIVLDGVNDWIDISNSSSFITGTNPFTIESWTNKTSGSYGAILGNYGSGYSTGLWWATAGLYIQGSVYHSDHSNAMAGVHHSAVTRDSSGNVVLYRDGVQVGTGVLTSSIPSGINWRIGADVNGGAEPLTGSIYVVKAYNKVLTSTEISQNFNSLRTRFGI